MSLHVEYQRSRASSLLPGLGKSRCRSKRIRLLCVSKYSSYYPGDKGMFSAQLKLFPEPTVAREPKLSGWPPPSEETPTGGVGAGVPQHCGCWVHSTSPSCPVPALLLQPDWTQMPWKLRPNWADHGARRL